MSRPGEKDNVTRRPGIRHYNGDRPHSGLGNLATGRRPGHGREELSILNLPRSATRYGTAAAVSATLLIAWLSVESCTPEPKYSRSGRLEAPDKLAIAHGLGRIGRFAKTNSIEALEANYKRGFRWFEVDLDTTADGTLVCTHPAPNSLKLIGVLGSLSEITESDFLERRFAQRFHTQTFQQLVERLSDLPDMIVVTDSKVMNAKIIARLASHIDAVDPALRARIVLQMYHTEELSKILDMEARGGAFGGTIFTLYNTQISDADLLAFVEKSGIEWITMPAGRFRPSVAADLHRLGAKVFVHTLNKLETIHRFLEDGADGVYTDDQPPASVSGSSVRD